MELLYGGILESSKWFGKDFFPFKKDGIKNICRRHSKEKLNFWIRNITLQNQLKLYF